MHACYIHIIIFVQFCGASSLVNYTCPIFIGSTEYSIQSNSTMLALYGGEEDQGNLYIYKLDGT